MGHIIWTIQYGPYLDYYIRNIKVFGPYFTTYFKTFLLGLPIVFGLIQMAILPFCYDSPGYLLGVDKEKARKAAKWYKLEIDEDYVAPKTPSLSEVISGMNF